MFNDLYYSYQEILTDPSYAGQFVVMTNPHIGNTGINFGWSIFCLGISQLVVLGRIELQIR